jgi:hypothetical protein
MRTEPENGRAVVVPRASDPSPSADWFAGARAFAVRALDRSTCATLQHTTHMLPIVGQTCQVRTNTHVGRDKCMPGQEDLWAIIELDRGAARLGLQ